MEDHTKPKLAEWSSLAKHFDYSPDYATKPKFTPTKFAEVTWMMSHAYADCWEIIYHAKIPEMLWEFNMQAGEAFADLVKEDPDPQAIAVSLPKGMDIGETYRAYCFLEESTKKAVYLVAPKADDMKVTDLVLVVVANYSWEN